MQGGKQIDGGGISLIDPICQPIEKVTACDLRADHHSGKRYEDDATEELCQDIDGCHFVCGFAAVSGNDDITEYPLCIGEYVKENEYRHKGDGFINAECKIVGARGVVGDLGNEIDYVGASKECDDGKVGIAGNEVLDFFHMPLRCGKEAYQADDDKGEHDDRENVAHIAAHPGLDLGAFAFVGFLNEVLPTPTPFGGAEKNKDERADGKQNVRNDEVFKIENA